MIKLAVMLDCLIHLNYFLKVHSYPQFLQHSICLTNRSFFQLYCKHQSHADCATFCNALSSYFEAICLLKFRLNKVCSLQSGVQHLTKTCLVAWQVRNLTINVLCDKIMFRSQNFNITLNITKVLEEEKFSIERNGTRHRRTKYFNFDKYFLLFTSTFWKFFARLLVNRMGCYHRNDWTMWLNKWRFLVFTF